MIVPTTFESQLIASPAPTDQGRNYSSLPLDIRCPQLRPRPHKSALSVQDLRPDDISAVIGIGDSVMAGFAAKGITNGRFLSINTLNEDRGVSFAMGGDRAAITLPNIIHYYSPGLVGSSVGRHLLSICFGDQFCPYGQYRESIDVLNAAQSGARSLNLNHEIDYLLDRLEEYYRVGTLKPTDWKLLTFFIGSNDLCHACAVPTSLPIPFAVDVSAAIERISRTIRNVFIQALCLYFLTVGVMSIDQIFIATQAYPEYCQPFEGSTFVMHDHECMCAHSDANRTIMSELTPQYNAALEEIVGRYPPNDSFAVVYQPLKMDISTFPIEAIRYVYMS
ncbi:hypothetical protein BX666DRAFT_1849325 [Dichotomocladium elegans]|nr:hypothetical protein BX666DRAFT_1849325 [Dichotomocladium elegans]